MPSPATLNLAHPAHTLYRAWVGEWYQIAWLIPGAPFLGTYNVLISHARSRLGVGNYRKYCSVFSEKGSFVEINPWKKG